MASPPPGFLTVIKTEMVNFFWDALHWVPQAVLFLSCDEISHFYLALMILFIQRFLAGATDLMWREVANCVFRRVNGLGLDEALFLTDFNFLSTGGLSPFYRNVFRSCAWL